MPIRSTKATIYSALTTSPACSLATTKTLLQTSFDVTVKPSPANKNDKTSCRLQISYIQACMSRETMEGKGKELAVGSYLSKSLDESRVDSHSYYLARRTTMEMLRDRGYDISNEDINLTLQEFRALYGDRPSVDRLRISAQYCSDSSKKIAVVFCGSGIVKVNAIREITADVLGRENLTGLILVLQSDITSQALKAVELFSFRVELFQLTGLLVNITKHVLRPKHRVLNDQEKESLLKKLSIQEQQLPKLLKKDPTAKYYGLEKGQVVEVTHKGEGSESHVSYRCVW